MRQRSLRLRLLTGAALWVALTILITGAAIFYLFRSSVERDTRADLAASLDRLVALIEPGAEAPLLREPMPDPRYEQPYGGVYWQVQVLDGEVVDRSRSLWDYVLTPPSGTDRRQPVVLAGPDGQALAALVQEVDYGTGAGRRAYLVTVAEDRSILDQTISSFGGDMAAALVTLALATLAAAWLVVQIGLSPLDALRRGVETIRRGGADRLVDRYPTEVMPLVGEVNELLALRDKSVEFARSRAADLAHGLRTPLQVLAATSGKMRKAGDAANAGVIDDILSEMSDRIDYQLRLARLRLRTPSDLLSTSLDTALTRTLAVVGRTREGERLAWEVTREHDVAVNVDGHDLLELLGVLLENAAKWARTRVAISLGEADGFGELVIEDDGPGLTEQQITRLGVRGRRFDESRQGSGFGLAIAMEILELNNGSANLDRSPLGGLRVRLRLPVAGNETTAAEA